jgi:hypothetical protein
MCSEQVSQSTDDPRYNVERAKSLCSELAEKYDTVRASIGTTWQRVLKKM